MSRNICIAAVLFAALLLAVFVWLWVDAEWGISSAPPNTAAPESAQIQTPPLPRSINADKSDGEAEETGVGAADGSRSQDSPYQFKDWEEALDYLANLVAEEFERLLRTGSFSDKFEAAGAAYANVAERTRKDTALFEALKSYYSQIPRAEKSPNALLVRTGHFSPDVLKVHITLPNGEKYLAEHNELVVITYQVLYPRTAEDRASDLEQIRLTETAILELEAALESSPNNADIRLELDRLHTNLKDLKEMKPRIKKHTRRAGAFDGAFSGDLPSEGAANVKTTRLDFGIIRAEDLWRGPTEWGGDEIEIIIRAKMGLFATKMGLLSAKACGNRNRLSPEDARHRRRRPPKQIAAEI